MPPSEIRREARKSLKGKWGTAVVIMLAFFAISVLMEFVQNSVEQNAILYKLLDIVYVIISVPLYFGLMICFIKLKRSENFSPFDFIKEGFERFGKSWVITGHILIRLLLPLACLVLIVILQLILMFTKLNFIFSLLYTILLIATIIYVACRTLLYLLAFNICYDNPELSAKECVKKSEELMKGNRGNYILLELSFIGWIFLAGFTFGIGMLWLTPYMQVATVCFYEKVAKIETIAAEPAEKVQE